MKLFTTIEIDEVETEIVVDFVSPNPGRVIIEDVGIVNTNEGVTFNSFTEDRLCDECFEMLALMSDEKGIQLENKEI